MFSLGSVMDIYYIRSSVEIVSLKKSGATNEETMDFTKTKLYFSTFTPALPMQVIKASNPTFNKSAFNLFSFSLLKSGGKITIAYPPPPAPVNFPAKL